MKRHILLTIIFISIKLYAGNDLTVLAINGINLRTEPNINSQIIMSLPFGTVVSAIDQVLSKPDTVNQVIGEWIKISILKDVGFVFSPYLYRNIKVNLLQKSSEILMLKEGLPGYILNYDPKLNYYGFYRDSIGFYIEEIRVSIVLSKVDGMSEFQNLDCLEDFPNVLVKTNKVKKSILIFGVRDSLVKGRLKTTFFNEKFDSSDDYGFLYPEETISLFGIDNEYYLRGFDSVSTDNNCQVEKRYQLEFYYYVYDSIGAHQKRVPQNLSNFLNLYGAGKEHSEYRTPKILWAGDLNTDGLVDFIIHQHTMTEGGGVAITNTLFVAKNNSNKIIIKKEAEEVTGSCH
jgi:hypothetical protein